MKSTAPDASAGAKASGAAPAPRRSETLVAGSAEWAPDPATARITVLLAGACRASNETVWPWYSYVAPVSWLVESDINVGRGNVNFSEWNEYSEKLQNLKRYKIGEEVDEGEMPLWYYVPLHSEAKLSQADIDLIISWSNEE